MEVNSESVVTGMGVAGISLLFIRKIITSFFSDKKEVTKDNAESNLYHNLVAENTRMSEQLAKLSEQLQVITATNLALLEEVGSLKRYIKMHKDWEQYGVYNKCLSQDKDV